MICLWLALFCYINLGKKGVPNPCHGCLWTTEYSYMYPPYTHTPTHTQTHTYVIFSSPDDLISPNKISIFDVCLYLINQTTPGNTCNRTFILKRHFTLNKTGRSAPSPWKSLPLACVRPTEKHLWNNYQMYQILKWMNDSVHYFSKKNNCITVNTI